MNPLAQFPQIYTRIAGICYLLIILLGIFGQLIVRNSLVVMNDAAMTASNITESPLLWRLEIVGDIAMHLPALSPYTFLLLGICLIAELSLCLWLLIKGVKLPAWQHALQRMEN